ncbi:MAG: BamA/TamA family outer membrane protein [Chitinophagaceae bacterium]
MKLNHNVYILLILGVLLTAYPSCTVVKQYPKDKPFLFENTVNIKGDVPKDKKPDYIADLMTQLEDSAKVNENTELPWPKAPWVIPVNVIKRPPVFDSVASVQSTVNMRNYMVSKGYRQAFVTYDSSLKISDDEHRIKVNYTVDAGKLYTIDSVAFVFPDSNLNAIVKANHGKSLLKKGEPFDYDLVDQELNRLVNLFKNNGYYRITRDEVVVEADSSFAELIDPTIDPFEYIRRLAEIEARRKDNPMVDLYVRQVRSKDTSRLQQYKIGQVTVIPDSPPDLDELDIFDTVETFINKYKVISFQNTFNPKFVVRQIELRPGELYSQENFIRTQSNFNRLGAWQSQNLITRVDDSTRNIDFILRLIPAKKQFFSVDLEGSSVLNTSQLVLVGSGKIGLAVNFRLRNRNIGKRAIQLENTIRTGIEFNDFSKILSGEITLGNRLTIPWLMTPFSEVFEKKFLSAKTIVAADISLIDRFQYYRLRTINTFFGYEWKPKSNITWQFKPLNIELTRIDVDSLFLDAILQNPLLVYAYNNGLIVGTNVGYSRTFNKPLSNKVNTIRLFAEESGVLLGALAPGLTRNGKIFSDLYRFIKLDVDFRHYRNWKKSSFVFRAFAGVGFAFPTKNVDRQGEVTLPFFKSYFSGGPNSMRGWQIRKLGIGSNIFLDTVANGSFNDKYADVQLETNFEYRFNMFRLFGFWFRGAVFTDIGNIWFRNDVNGNFPGAELQLNKLYKDLAVASGAGVRMDFTYFLLRFDWGFPIKDPRYGPEKASSTGFSSTSKYGWFVDGVWNKPTFQFAIGYPF